MERETFYEKVLKLAQKSRKALRLYTSVSGLGQEGGHEFSDVQVEEWRKVNAELLRQLSSVLDSQYSKNLASEVVIIRDHFCESWRGSEAEINKKQRELLGCAENSDFVRSAILSRELVVLKARMQAAQAAHHEFNEVLKGSKFAERTIELPVESALEHEEPPVMAKVIPLRRA